MADRSSNRAVLLVALHADHEAKLAAVTAVLKNIEAHVETQNSEPTRRLLAKLITSLESVLDFADAAASLRARLRALKKIPRHWKSTKAERMAAKIARASLPAFEPPSLVRDVQKDIQKDVPKEVPKADLKGTSPFQVAASETKPDIYNAAKKYIAPHISPTAAESSSPSGITCDTDKGVKKDIKPADLTPVRQSVIQVEPAPVTTQCRWCLSLAPCAQVAGEGWLCSFCVDVWRDREAAIADKTLIEPKVTLRQPPVRVTPQFVPPRRPDRTWAGAPAAISQPSAIEAKENSRRAAEIAEAARLASAPFGSLTPEEQRKRLGI